MRLRRAGAAGARRSPRGRQGLLALGDAAAPDQALPVQGSQATLAELDQRQHLLVQRQRLVFLPGQAEESFHKGLQTHSCKEKVLTGDREHSISSSLHSVGIILSLVSCGSKAKRACDGCEHKQSC